MSGQQENLCLTFGLSLPVSYSVPRVPITCPVRTRLFQSPIHSPTWLQRSRVRPGGVRLR